MIKCKFTHGKKTEVLKFESIMFALKHFEIFTRNDGSIKISEISVVKIIDNEVTIREHNELLGDQESIYSGEKEEMSCIVFHASTLKKAIDERKAKGSQK